MEEKMTGKQRAAFRRTAHSLQAVFQIGKSGVTDAVVVQTNGVLTARELVKIKVLLETSPIAPKEAASELAEKTKAEIIQVIGGAIVLYRYNPELHKKK